MSSTGRPLPPHSWPRVPRAGLPPPRRQHVQPSAFTVLRRYQKNNLIRINRNIIVLMQTIINTKDKNLF